MTKSSVINEIIQFANIQTLCIVVAIVVYFLHSLYTLYEFKGIFSLGCSNSISYIYVTRLFRSDRSFENITNFVENTNSVLLLYLYFITLGASQVGIYFSIVLCLCARLTRYHQITTKKLILPVFCSGMLVCACSGVLYAFLKMFIKSSGRYSVYKSVQKSVYITAPTICVVLCVLVVVHRLKGRLRVIFGSRKSTSQIP